MSSVYAKPAKLLRSHEVTGRALWAAHLLTNIKGLDANAPLGRKPAEAFTLTEVAERLAEMCVSTAKQPTPTEAYAIHKAYVLRPTTVIDYRGCECCGAFGALHRDAEVFPWRRVIAAVNHLTRDFSQEAIAQFTLPWQEREELRLAGIYRPLPWDLSPINDHFAHISLKDPSLVAYTTDAKKGERDIQTQLKPGKYLTEFYPGLDPDKIRALAAQVTAQVTEVKFAVTPDEVEHVYTTGPSSCMSYATSQAKSQGWPEHPARAYGNSDFQVAYLTDRAGRVNARVVVWPEKKIYSRIYGDHDRMERCLQQLGYQPNNSGRGFDGARIRRISYRATQVLLPSIDHGNRYSKVDDNWLYTNANGPIGCNHGLTTLPVEITCGCGCGKTGYSTTMALLGDGTTRWTHACVKAAVTAKRLAQCQGDNRYYPLDQMAMGAHFSNQRLNVSIAYCKGHNFFQCAGSQRWFQHDYFVAIRMADGSTWEREYFRRNGIAHNGKNYSKQQELDLDLALDKAVAASVKLEKSNAQSS